MVQSISDSLSVIGLGTAAWTAIAGIAAAYAINKVLDNRALGNPLVLGDRSWMWAREIVLITGGSSGIGRAMVDEFARRSIKVVVLDRRRPGPETPFAEGVIFYEVDVTADERVHEVAERVRREVGDPTVLINNAGIAIGKPVLELTAEQVRQVFDVNAIAPITMVREFLPAMAAADHGHVVTMASMASFVVIAGNVDYSCTKASVMALHEGIAQELRHRYNARNVRTTIVHPYWTQTSLLGGLTRKRNFHDAVMEPKTIARAVVGQVLSGCSGQIVLPWIFAYASMLRSFPSWLQEWIRDSKADTLREVAP